MGRPEERSWPCAPEPGTLVQEAGEGESKSTWEGEVAALTLDSVWEVGKRREQRITDG